MNGLYKIELVYGPDQRPWKKIQDVELATLAWGALVQHPTTPRLPQRFATVEYEDACSTRPHEELGNQTEWSPSNPGRFNA